MAAMNQSDRGDPPPPVPQGWDAAELGRLFRAITARVAIANLAAGALAFFYLNWLGIIHAGPAADSPRGHRDLLVSLVVVIAYVAVASAVGSAVVTRRWIWPLQNWLLEPRLPTPEEQQTSLTLPLSVSVLILIFWVGAAAIFFLLNLVALQNDLLYTSRLAVGVILGGLVTSAVVYFLLERSSRPLFARALAAGGPVEPIALALRRRLLLAWVLGSAVPLLALGLAPLGLTASQRAQLVGPTVFLLVVALLAGGLISVGVARSIADPIDAVRARMRQVESGRLDITITVDDGGEVGLLQAGFNRMVEGLRERERLRDLFGRHVGVDVAREAIERGVSLGGEIQPASVLFVDLSGSTALAQRLEPHEVVSLLNDFFDAVVHAVSAEGGWVNKFEGDAALCVFGTPVPYSDHSSRALRAALALRSAIQELATRYPGLDAGIGVSSGEVVAGNVGSEDRFEFTVIGDPVNEAARLTEAAKSDPSRLYASRRAVEVPGDEAANWRLTSEMVLRGRSTPTAIYVPTKALTGGESGR